MRFLLFLRLLVLRRPPPVLFASRVSSSLEALEALGSLSLGQTAGSRLAPTTLSPAGAVPAPSNIPCAIASADVPSVSCPAAAAVAAAAFSAAAASAAAFSAAAFSAAAASVAAVPRGSGVASVPGGLNLFEPPYPPVQKKVCFILRICVKPPPLVPRLQ